MTSLIGFDYSTSIVKRIHNPLITPAELRDRLKICEEDQADIRQMERHLRTAVSLIEKQTGIVVSPRIVEMCFDRFPAGDIPLPYDPTWDQETLDRYRVMFCECGTIDEQSFGACLPQCAVSIEVYKNKNCEPDYYPISTKFFADNKRKPNRLRLADCCDCWPCDPCGRPVKVTFVAGYGCAAQIENHNPELLEAIIMTATDLFDCYSMAEILERQGPFWAMIGHAC